MSTEEQSKDPTHSLPLFPLPSTVFFPSTDLPLHIFEPRYRQMIDEALEGDGKIGMVLLKPGWESNYHAKPEIAQIGCLGTIDRHTKFTDGKYNILLRGVNRFQIVKEFDGKPYRRAQIELLKEENNECIIAKDHAEKIRLIEHTREFTNLLPDSRPEKIDSVLKACKWMSELVDQLTYRLDITVEQKQSFLEERDVQKRVELIHLAIQMKIELVQMAKTRMKKGFDVRLN
jgi:Lon protease-like protein